MKARFRRPLVEGRRWRYGVLVEDPSSDDAVIRDNHTGGLYAISAEYVQIQTRGPRGGVKWLPL